MKYRNDKMEHRSKERRLNAKEQLLVDTLRYWSFHQAAANIDFRHIDVDAALASWANYPECLDDYPKVITKKVKLDPKDIPKDMVL